MAKNDEKNKVVAPKSYNSLEALEAEFNIPDVEPYRPCIGEDENGEKVYITFRSPKDFDYTELELANAAEQRGDSLTYFEMSLSRGDLRKVRDLGIKAYQMGLLMAASQKYYNDAYAVDDAAGN